LVLLGLVFEYIFGFLVFILVVVGLFCQYRSQVIGWKVERLVSEMTCYVSSGTLNSTNSTQVAVEAGGILGSQISLPHDVGN